MNQNRISEPANAGQLFASHLFGKAPEAVKSTLPLRNFRKQTSRIKLDPSTRTERLAFTEVCENKPPVSAVLPLLTKEAKAQTMINYDNHVSNYNNCIREKNEEIKKFNNSITPEEFTEVQKEYSRLFKIKNSRLKGIAFNNLAEKFNAEYGNCIPLKNIQTLKYTTRPIFFQMLHLYSIQIEEKTAEYAKLGVTEASTVPQFEVNSHHITNLKSGDVYSIDVNNKTIRNHKQRLEEAGILYHYYFQGHKKGVKMHINSQILTVLDAKTKNLTVAENQTLTSLKGKIVTYNNHTTRAFNKNIKKRENGQAAFLDKGTPSAGFSFSFYENVPLQEAKSKLGGGGENVKVSETLSDMLENQIIPTQELAKKLSSGDFNNYSRIKKAVFDKEAYSGTMSRESFKELVVQEFFKNAAKLYRGKNVYVGSWKTAINSYMEKQFLVNNGNGDFLYSKALMAEKLEQMLWRLNNAQQWFNRTKINPLFPSLYFDFTRNTSKEIGFEYTKKAYEKHVNYLETKPRKEKNIAKKAVERKLKIDFSKKFETVLKRFFKEKIDFNTLFDYVKNNLPAEFLDKLAQRMVLSGDNSNVLHLAVVVA
jgi:hypothetical protein